MGSFCSLFLSHALSPCLIARQFSLKLCAFNLPRSTYVFLVGLHIFSLQVNMLSLFPYNSDVEIFSSIFSIWIQVLLNTWAWFHFGYNLVWSVESTALDQGSEIFESDITSL